MSCSSSPQRARPCARHCYALHGARVHHDVIHCHANQHIICGPHVNHFCGSTRCTPRKNLRTERERELELLATRHNNPKISKFFIASGRSIHHVGQRQVVSTAWFVCRCTWRICRVIHGIYNAAACVHTVQSRVLPLRRHICDRRLGLLRRRASVVWQVVGLAAGRTGHTECLMVVYHRQ